jgi:stage II sporulation protein D
MDIETAVAAGLAAEMPAGAGEDALAAMAVAIRSYYAAGPRHAAFDFCDTTHCQFHRSPPRADDPAMRATERTRGIVATFNGDTFAPYYSAACGGRTRTPEQVGLRSGAYPYRSAPCPFCAREEPAWRRDLPYDVGAELARGASEPLRLALARSIGRSKAPPGNNYSVRREGSTLVFEGSGRGHGIGICQRGAIGMAREGVSWRAILQYYLPEGALRIMPDGGDR